MKGFRASWQATLGVVVLGLLLAVLATLQYRWITQISEAERERRARQLQAAVGAFEEDLDQELSRLLLFLHPDFGVRPPFPAPGSTEEATLVDRWNLWTSTSHHPELVAEVYLVELGNGVVWRRLDPRQERFETVAVPGELEGLDRRLRERLSGRTRWSPPRFLSNALTLVLPLGGATVRRHGPPARFEAWRSEGPNHLLVLRLDGKVLSDQILPELVERHFGAEFDVEVRTAPPESRLLYGTSSSEIAERKPDLRRALHFLRPFERMRPGGPREDRRPPPSARPFLPPSPPALELLVVHRQGSLDAVVRQTRRRNLSVGLGILALLAASVLMLLVATVRARRLARQQVEFVAGLTHELHTPLAAILSASANLADGVVSSPQRVEEYGRLIGEHGKRLSALVGQALELAGLEAAEPARWEAVDLESVVAAASEACQPLRKESGADVDTEVEEDLPAVRGRSEALQQVVENLLRNALRHGGAGGVVRIRLRRRAGAGEVELVVEDQGPGFEDEDLPHVFEPFYRGRNAERSPGAGLGLRLVEQIVRRHGGTVRASNRAKGGAAVVVRLPAVAEGRDG